MIFQSVGVFDQTGIVIGRTHLPLVNEGDAVVQLACSEDIIEVAEHVEQFHTYQ